MRTYTITNLDKKQNGEGYDFGGKYCPFYGAVENECNDSVDEEEKLQLGIDVDATILEKVATVKPLVSNVVKMLMNDNVTKMLIIALREDLQQQKQDKRGKWP